MDSFLIHFQIQFSDTHLISDPETLNPLNPGASMEGKK